LPTSRKGRIKLKKGISSTLMPSYQRSLKSCSRIKILNRNNLELWKIILLLIEHLIKYRVGQRRKKEDNMSMKEG
jgi:hypothetical protein